MPLVLKLLTIVLTAFLYIISSQPVFAAATISPTQVTENTPTVTITFSPLISGQEYEVCLHKNYSGRCSTDLSSSYRDEWRKPLPPSGTITVCGDGRDAVKLCSSGSGNYFHAETYEVDLVRKGKNVILDTASFNVAEFLPKVTLTPATAPPGALLTLSFPSPPNGWRWPNTNKDDRNQYEFIWVAKGVDGGDISKPKIDGGDNNNVINLITEGPNFPFTLTNLGTYTLSVQRDDTDKIFIVFEIKVTTSGITVTGTSGFGQPGKNPCVGNSCQTALGPISTNFSEFSGRILAIAIGLAGGIALIIMVVGAIKVLTSSGDQQKTAAGRDMIVAAVAGLLFLIFSALILRFIGNDLLGLFRAN